MTPVLLAVVDWHEFFFMLFALIACVFALAVVFAANIVRMAFYLIISLGATAGLFFLAGAEFVGAMQLMIYVGGTLVLLIFGVMLTAQKSFVDLKVTGGEWVMAAIAGGSLLALLLYAAFQVEDWRRPLTAEQREELIVADDAYDAAHIGMAVLGVRVDKARQPDEQLQKGMSGYLLPFEIVSVHLLVVLIGAGYLARTKLSTRGVRTATDASRGNVALPFTVKALIYLGAIASIAAGVACFVLAGSISGAIGLNLACMYVVGGLFFMNVLLKLIVLARQKWAVSALVIVALLQAATLFWGGAGLLIAIGFAVVALLPIGLLIFLLCSGQRSVWSQME